MKNLPSTFLFLLTLPTLLSAQPEKFLTLEEAWETALKNNPTEVAAAARADQAFARFQQARSAYQPRLGLNASGSRVDYADNSMDRFPPGTEGEAELYDAGLQATWLLWDNGSRGNRVDAARFQSDASLAAMMDSREQLLADVGRAFTSAQLARANLRIAEEDVVFQTRQLENSIRKEKAGLDSRADRLNFEIRKLAAESTVVQQQANFAGSMAALAALLGLPEEVTPPPPVKLDPDDTMLPDEIPEVAILWNTAKQKLPALEQSRLQLEAAKSSVDAFKGEYGPSLSAFGNLSAEREDDPAFESGDLGNAVGLQLSWDLWTGNARRQRVFEAEAQVTEVMAADRQLQLQVLSAIKQAHAEYTASVEAETLSAKTFELSKENRDLVEASYEAGRETLLRLNEAQRDFNNAGSRYVTARLQRQLAWIRLQQATGTLRDQIPVPAETNP